MLERATVSTSPNCPFRGSSTKRWKQTHDEFLTPFMSVGKTSNDGNVSIFTKEGVTVHKEKYVLITCQIKPILIGKRDEHGRYRIALTQACRKFQPRKPTKKSKKYFQQANSVYNLTSTEEAIKWMHEVCGYTVKSTWLKAIKAGNYVGWPLITDCNVTKY